MTQTSENDVLDALLSVAFLAKAAHDSHNHSRTALKLSLLLFPDDYQRQREFLEGAGKVE